MAHNREAWQEIRPMAPEGQGGLKSLCRLSNETIIDPLVKQE